MFLIDPPRWVSCESYEEDGYSTVASIFRAVAVSIMVTRDHWLSYFRIKLAAATIAPSISPMCRDLHAVSRATIELEHAVSIGRLSCN